MCNQIVGLIQAAIERVGITTVSITLLKEVTETIQPPRAMFVPYRLGYPLGQPNNPELQKRVIKTALSLLSRNDLPIMTEFEE
ncbi:MAG: hypothetical protein FD167_4168 [bacterium]|nr:MAG: hypothetical protein FD167_4168 [bacterium]